MKAYGELQEELREQLKTVEAVFFALKDQVDRYTPFDISMYLQETYLEKQREVESLKSRLQQLRQFQNLNHPKIW